MRSPQLFTPLVAAAFATSFLARAAEPLPGHSIHGESFSEGPRQAAVLMPGMPEIKFPVSTQNPEARKFFEQGVGQLHGFWYFESERSFRQAAALDPECAMFYWGMAMSNVNNDKRAKEFLKKAVERKSKATGREQLWIASLENYYRDDKRDKAQRQLDFIRDLEAIVQAHPDDIEAKAFLAWKIWHARDKAPISSHQAVDALLDQIFAAQPMHPAHHYRIHLWDNAKPVRALGSAAKCGQTSPGIAHMWHMPGHTYSKLRRFDDAVWQQEASTRVDHAYMIKDLVLPDQIHNYAHNEEWLVRNFNELGRARDATGLARSLIEIPRHPAFNTLDKATTSASYGRTRLIETLLKWELWDQLVALAANPYLTSVSQSGHEAARLRALGIAQFHRNQPKELAATLAKLEDLDRREKESPKGKPEDKGNKEADARQKAAADKQAASAPTTEIRKALPASKQPDVATRSSGPKDQSSEVPASGDKNKPASGNQTGDKKPANAPANALAELRALAAVLNKDKPAAMKQLEAASDVPKERLARYWLRLGDKKKAEELTKNFNQDLAGLLAKAEVLGECGKVAESKSALEAAGKVAFAMDRDLPAARRADELARKLGISGDWRAPAPKRTDVGVRPDLNSLGPVHWHPPEARTWSAVGADGKTVTSSDFRGKNTILIFYLGHDCTHCMEQLNAFAGAADQFKAANLSLVAISSESVADTAKAHEKCTKGGAFPFPLLSDEKLKTFKTYRVYDDFEKMALHAVVFIDSTARIRWIDISFQPFTDTKFLLDECQRLLQMRVPPASPVARATGP